MIGECSIPILEAALAGKLSADDEARLTQHLGECEACALELERLVGEPQWRRAATLLAADEFDDAFSGLGTTGDWSEVDFTVEHLEPAEEPGTLGRLGGYDVLEIIGRGGMGVVLKAFDRELKRCVAIKVLAPHLANSALAKKRFAREAQAAAAVVHPHVLAIHQVRASGALPFLVMPLVSGESLAQRLERQGSLELLEVLRIGMQAAAGLSAAHDQGLVHRDVKPANILLETGVERAVLTDFGLARAADNAAMTRLDIIAGTPQYMSPEQAKGEPLDGRSDLFSLGCVLFEMATGVSPFRADSALATMRRLVEEPPPALGSLNPELPPWFAEIVERLLEKDPANRLGSAREVSELLEGCLAHLQHPAAAPLPASISKPVTASAPRRRSYRILGAITMMATLGLVLCGAMAMFATDPPDIAGTWSGEDWGKVVLKKTDDGGYAGTYTDTFGQSPGAITLKWSRIERRFNGIWREGDDRFGELSVRLVGNEIRGALTTDAKSRINPATPKLADLAWRRDGTAGTTPLPTGPMPRSPGHGSPMPVPTNPGAVYWPPGSPAPAAPKTGGALPGNGMSSAPETPGRPRPIEPPYSKAPPTPFPTPTATFAPPRVWAIAKYPPANGPWWTPEGHVLSTRPIDPDGLDLRSVADPKLAWYVVLLRVPGGFDPLINGDAIRVVGRPWFSLGRQSLQARQYLASRQGGEVVALAVGLPAAAVSFDLTVEAAIGSWQSISYMHSQGVGKKNETTDSGAEWRVAERSGRLQIDVELPKADGQWRIAVKNDGNLSFTPVLVPDAKNGPMTRLQAEIPGPIDLKGNVSFVLQSRRYEKIHLGKIALRPESGDGKGPGRITMPSELEPPPVIPKANGQVLRKITVNGGVSALAASPDGKLLAVAAHGGPDSVFVLDVELGGVRKLSSSDDNEKAILAAEMHLRNVTVASQVETLAFSPDGKLLALGTNVGQVKLYDASSGELVRSFDDVDRKRKNLPKFLELRLAHGSVRSLAFSPDGKTLATCGSAIDYARDHIARDFYRAATEGLLKTWDVKTGQRLIDFKNVYRGYVFDVAFSPDGSELASVGNGGKAGWVQLFDPHSGKVKRSIGSQAGPGAREVTTCLAYSPDGKRLAVGFKLLDKTKDQNSGMFALLSPASGVVDSKQTSLSPITKIAFTPDGTEVATLASESNVLKFWDASAGTQRSEMRLGVPGEPVRLTTFAFLPQARILALGGASGGCVELRALEIVPAIRP